MISIQHLTKRFGRSTAVDDVSLTIPAGDAVAIWGPNGAGKSTVIRCVLGLLRYEGRVTIRGLDAERRGKAARRLIGYVPQELGFYDDLRVGEAVSFFGRLKGLTVGDPGAVLEGVGLAGERGKRIRDLSGGMKQRLALAIALLGDPEVLILDEVTASLDACGRGEFMGLLAGLAGSGRTLLFASHRLDEIEILARRVVSLDRGRVRGEWSSADFVSMESGERALHIRIDAAACGAAVELLRGRGFDARLNGVGIVVPVAALRKAEPLHILAEARIRVEDFDLLSDHCASRTMEVRA